MNFEFFMTMTHGQGFEGVFSGQWPKDNCNIPSVDSLGNLKYDNCKSRFLSFVNVRLDSLDGSKLCNQ